MIRFFSLIGLLVLLGAVTGAARAADTTAPGPLRIILTPAGTGCLAGAVQLPETGPGYQTIRNDKTAFWGAPHTVQGVQTLAVNAQRAGLAELYIGEFSRPRGGPIAGGHVSHQAGLDADIYFDLSAKPALSTAQRANLAPAGLVRADRRGTDPARWREEHARLLHLAASLPQVDRILVNFAIKRQLCENVTGDRAWLRLIRPWYGHAAHFHIRFRCPPGQAECTQAPPPPSGEGCDASLQWWFDQLDAPPAAAGPARRPPPVPPACQAILAAPRPTAPAAR